MLSLWSKLAAAFTAILAILHPMHLQPHVNYGGITPSLSQLSQDATIDPYTVVGNDLEIAKASTIPEAGTDATIVDTTQPKVTLDKFNGEVAMGVTLQGMTATGARKFMSNEVDWQQGNETMSVTPLAASSTFEDGGYNIDITLASEPASNVFNFSIDGAQNLDFFYQSPLWQETGLSAPTANCSDTDCTTSEGVSHRPSNVVGSYAVYYKNHANHVQGQTNYATGKAYQIFRPLVTDANGVTIWANLSYSNGILTVTLPQGFLDSAVYPVNIDPTFGYSTAGATGFAATTDRGLLTTPYAASSGDTITQYTLSGLCQTGTLTYDVATYSIVAGKPSSRLDTPKTITINSSSQTWFNSSVISVSMSGGTNYDVAFGNQNATGCTGNDFIFRDSGTPNTSLSSGGAGALPASWTESTNEAQLYSVYATYTTGGGGAAPPAKDYITGAKGYITGAKGYVK